MKPLDLSRPHGRLLVALVGLALLLAACGDDGGGGEATPEPDEGAPQEDAPDEGAEGEGAQGATVEVTLVDYAFEGVPESVPAGTQFTVVNESDSELHELVAFRLPDDEERPVEELVQLPPEEFEALGQELGEPDTVLLAEPGGDMIPALGDGTLTEPGRYALMCFIPTGADPQAYLEASESSEGGPPEAEGGPPHFLNGMVDEVTVE